MIVWFYGNGNKVMVMGVVVAYAMVVDAVVLEAGVW